MNNYKIIVKNSGNCVVYDEIITAKNENEALKIMLQDNIIYCDDTIEIQEN